VNRQQEKVFVAALCGVVVAVAAGWLVQPTLAEGYKVEQVAQITGVAPDDQLNVRRWPASNSKPVGTFEPGSHVWVDRCIEKPGDDWCLVDAREIKGWVNARFLTVRPDRDI
jgi:SH3-like domain-containing protein